jgi:hypothetical protein
MFSYLSGFVSEIDLDQDAEVYVYLLFPQRYAKNLSKELFHSFRALNKRHGVESFNSPTLDGIGSIHDHYIPFAFPFKASYVRDTGVYLPEGDKSETVKWLEDNLNVDMTEFLGDLSNRFIKNDDEEITYDNIFDYLSVAFEHVSFVDNIKEVLKKDKSFMNGIDYADDFYRYYKLTLTQGLMLGEDITLVAKNKSKLELMESEEIEASFIGSNELFFQEAYYLASLEHLMVNLNKVYKPCSRGGQRMDQVYTDLMLNSQKETNTIVFKGYNEDE